MLGIRNKPGKMPRTTSNGMKEEWPNLKRDFSISQVSAKKKDAIPKICHQAKHAQNPKNP